MGYVTQPILVSRNLLKVKSFFILKSSCLLKLWAKEKNMRDIRNIFTIFSQQITGS